LPNVLLCEHGGNKFMSFCYAEPYKQANQLIYLPDRHCEGLFWSSYYLCVFQTCYWLFLCCLRKVRLYLVLMNVGGGSSSSSRIFPNPKLLINSRTTEVQERDSPRLAGDGCVLSTYRARTVLILATIVYMEFNAFHTVVLKCNYLKTVEHNK